MELGRHIKKHRNELGLSQDVLAEKIFVSRQTVSNWENDKSYPDVKSLLLLSEVFQVSLDTLIKGDVEEMKEQIKQEDMREFNRLGNIFAILLISVMVLAVPMVYFLKYVGFAIWGLLFVVTIVFAYKVDRKKKQYNIQTYKEIIAFMEGKTLDKMEQAKEEGKRPYQTVLIVIASSVVTIIVAVFMIWIIGIFS